MLTSKANKKLYPLYTGAGNLNTSCNLILTNWLNPLCFGWQTQLVASYVKSVHCGAVTFATTPEDKELVTMTLHYICKSYLPDEWAHGHSEWRSYGNLLCLTFYVFCSCFSAQALEMSNAFTTPIIYTIFNRSFRVGIIICQLAYWSCRQCSRWRIEQHSKLIPRSR